jgi:hypothetical protein
MPKEPLSPETLLLFLIRGLALVAVVFLCLAFWHPWQPGAGPDWKCAGLAVACLALAAICSWGLHSLKR